MAALRRRRVGLAQAGIGRRLGAARARRDHGTENGDNNQRPEYLPDDHSTPRRRLPRRTPVPSNRLRDCPCLLAMSLSRMGLQRVANETIQRTLRDRSHSTTVRWDDGTARTIL